MIAHAGGRRDQAELLSDLHGGAGQTASVQRYVREPGQKNSHAT
jgi:hypothetical protein